MFKELSTATAHAAYKTLCLILILGIIACKTKSVKSTEPIDAIELSDSCKSNPKHTFEVYVPKRANSEEKLPLLILIDAHGDGLSALKKFRLGADSSRCILVASNLVKNNIQNFEQAIRELIVETQNSLPVNKSLYMAGFSGGARMALNYATSNPLDGLILCGAMGSSEQLSALKSPVIAISGMDDFNFIETAQYLFQTSNKPSNLNIEITNDSHSWPDSLLLKNSLEFLVISNSLNKIEPEKLNNFGISQMQRIDSLIRMDKLIQAAVIAENLANSAVIEIKSDFKNKLNSIQSNPEYNNQLDLLNKNLEVELSVREPLIDAFSSKDENWWKHEIVQLLSNIKSAKNSFELDRFLRIKGFLGIACYSLGNQAKQQKDSTLLKKILNVYNLIEPENPDYYYLAAFIPFWDGNEKRTIEFLNRALSKGFIDNNMLIKDFPMQITKLLVNCKP